MPLPTKFWQNWLQFLCSPANKQRNADENNDLGGGKKKDKWLHNYAIHLSVTNKWQWKGSDANDPTENCTVKHACGISPNLVRVKSGNFISCIVWNPDLYKSQMCACICILISSQCQKNIVVMAMHLCQGG